MGDRAWFTADFCLQKSPVQPLKRCQTVADFYHIGYFVIFLHPNPLPGITFRSTKQTKSMMPFAMLDVHSCICKYHIYTDRIYMICSPSNSYHHNKTLHFSATADIPDFDPHAFHHEFQSNPGFFGGGILCVI